jgi:hypothetical protein
MNDAMKISAIITGATGMVGEGVLEVAIAMINSVTYGYEKQVLEVEDIIRLSKKQ